MKKESILTPQPSGQTLALNSSAQFTYFSQGLWKIGICHLAFKKWIKTKIKPQTLNPWRAQHTKSTHLTWLLHYMHTWGKQEQSSLVLQHTALCYCHSLHSHRDNFNMWPSTHLQISPWLVPEVTQPTLGSPNYRLLITANRLCSSGTKMTSLLKKYQLPITCARESSSWRQAQQRQPFSVVEAKKPQYQMLLCCHSVAAGTKKQHYPPLHKNVLLPTGKINFCKVTGKLQRHFT